LDPGIFFGLAAARLRLCEFWRGNSVSAEASLMFASLGIIQRAGTIRFSLTGAMTSFCRLLK
jgi:hypothetical protein